MKKLIAAVMSLSLICPLMTSFSVSAAEADVSLLSSSQVFEGGSGTEEDPYLVSTEEQLRLMFDLPDCSFKLLNDIDVTGEWSGSTSTLNFSGIFDGNYYTVSGLTNYFVSTNNGTIKNTKFSGGDISTATVAYMNNGTIENCSAAANVKEGVSKGSIEYRAAGFVYENKGTIRSCVYNGSVKLPTSDPYDSHYSAGFAVYNSGTIENCYSAAQIAAENSTQGFIYSNEDGGTIKNCYSASTRANSGLLSFGFCYQNHGTIESCYYNSDTAGSDQRPIGTPVSSLAMLLPSTYAGWDLDSVWDMDDSVNNGYPYLRMEQDLLPKVESIDFKNDVMYLRPGEEKGAVVNITPSDTGRRHIWSSSSDAAEVSETGIVTAVSEGTAEITLSLGSFSESFTVNVSNDIVGVNEVIIDQSALALDRGATYRLTASVDPANATDKGILWSSSDPSVASVSADGTVTAVSDGTAYITAASNYNDVSASCEVTVTTPVTGISISETDIDMYTGDTYTLTAEVSPDIATNKNIIWTSSDNDIASVSGGVITAKRAGDVTVTAKTEDGGYTAECCVTITVPVTEIVLNKLEITLKRGKTETLTANVLPADATDKTIRWTSSDTNVAVVNGDGMVTAISSGETVIRAAASNGVTAECKVTVIVPVDDITLDSAALKLNVGENRTLIPNVTPTDAYNKNVLWSSSDTTVATVDENGTVTAVSAGSAVITAETEDEGMKAFCDVTVVVPPTKLVLNEDCVELKQNESFTLEAQILPEDTTDKTVSWSSSDKEIVTVDENGAITALKPGSAVITAVCGTVTAQCVVNVGVKHSAAVEVGSVRACAGETVTIPVSISDNPGIAAFRISINFDSSKLTPESVESGAVLSKGSLTTNLEEEDFAGNSITVYWENPSDIKDDGELLLLTFSINEYCPDGDIPVTVSYEPSDIINQSYEQVKLNKTDGAVKVITVLPGDVFEDGEVDVKDGLKLSQYLAEWDISMTRFEKMAADVNADDAVNAKDGVKLSQYLAGWDIELFSDSDTAGSISFKVGDSKVKPGGYVDVPVIITENTGVSAFKLKISYGSGLTPVSITSALPDGNLTSNLQQGASSSEYVTAYWVNPTNITSTGTAFTIRFKADESAEGTLPITLVCNEGDICDQNLEELSSELIDGSVTIDSSAPESEVSAYTVKGLGIETETDGQEAYVTVPVIKNSSNAPSGMLIIVSYAPDGSLAGISAVPVEFDDTQTEKTFRSEIAYSGGGKLKAFIWDDLNHMTPLSNSAAN